MDIKTPSGSGQIFHYLFRKRPTIGLMVIFLGLTGLGALITGIIQSEPNKNTKYVAYIGRYTDHAKGSPEKQELNPFDLMHEVSLRTYLENIDLPYHQLQLKTFNCERSGAKSDSIYQLISKDSSIVMVIDNTWGEHIKVCANTIRENEIPVIAINADQNELNFGKNVVFTGSHDNTPYDITAFIDKVMHVKEVNFISEVDYPLHHIYLKALSNAGIKVNQQFLLHSKTFSGQDSLAFYKKLDSFYRANPEEEDRLLLLNVHVGIGNGLLDYIDQRFEHLKTIGHAYVVNPTHIRHFGNENHNDLIICSNPTDALTKTLHNNIYTLKERYPDYFKNPNHPMFVERCFDAIEMIKNKFEWKNDTSSLRKQDFIDYFRYLPNKTIVEEDELYEYDSTLTIMPELYFTEYSGGHFHSYPLQLNTDREVIPNLFFGMEIADIYDIDMNSNSFTSDFYYWVKLDTGNIVAEQYIIFQNMKQNESSKELIFEKINGSQIYKLYKVSGVFYVNYDLSEYPFDHQEIFIRAEILNPANKIKVSFDQKSFLSDSKKIEQFKITEWNKNRFYVTVDNEISLGMHGDPDIDDEKLSEFKNIYFRLDVKRKSTTPLLEIIVPLLMIGMISISLMFMRDISFENLGEVSIGVFMSIVAFSISYSASTPTSDYLTRADFLFWLTFIVVLFNFMVVVVINGIWNAEQIQKISIRKVSTLIGMSYFAAAGWIILGP